MTAMTVDRISAQIVRVDMMAVGRHAKAIMEAYEMEQPKTCTYSYNGTRCPIGNSDCVGCGWDVREQKRRHFRPLVYDEKTGLRRKIIGKVVCFACQGE